jgi:uncharacterized protein
MIRIVLDTNVLISAHLKDTGAEARVFDLVTNQRVSLCASDPILSEYEGVLSRPKFRIDKQRVSQSTDLIRRVAVLVTPSESVSASSDEPDNRFLECAEEGLAFRLSVFCCLWFSKRSLVLTATLVSVLLHYCSIFGLSEP